jgi:hypothetical protein
MCLTLAGTYSNKALSFMRTLWLTKISTSKYLFKFSLADYVEDPDTEDKQLCNICLDEIKVGKMLICGHIFHLRCLR